MVTHGRAGAIRRNREQRTATHHDPDVLRGVGLQEERIMGAGYSLRSWCQRGYGVYQIGEV